jgi:hypothetical protein
MKMTVTQSKASFFDRKAVTDAIGKAKAGVLARQGGLVRTIARRSMRKKKGPSKPGTPPNVHKGLLKDLLFFAFDPQTNTVVVGPAALGGSKAPSTLEYGGDTEEWGIYDRRGRFVPLRKMSREGFAAARKSGKVVKRKAKVAARPFMSAALAVAKPKLAAMWKDQVKAR